MEKLYLQPREESSQDSILDKMGRTGEGTSPSWFTLSRGKLTGEKEIRRFLAKPWQSNTGYNLFTTPMLQAAQGRISRPDLKKVFDALLPICGEAPIGTRLEILMLPYTLIGTEGWLDKPLTEAMEPYAETWLSRLIDIEITPAKFKELCYAYEIYWRLLLENVDVTIGGYAHMMRQLLTKVAEKERGGDRGDPAAKILSFRTSVEIAERGRITAHRSLTRDRYAHACALLRNDPRVTPDMMKELAVLFYGLPLDRAIAESKAADVNEALKEKPVMALWLEAYLSLTELIAMKRYEKENDPLAAKKETIALLANLPQPALSLACAEKYPEEERPYKKEELGPILAQVPASEHAKIRNMYRIFARNPGYGANALRAVRAGPKGESFQEDPAYRAVEDAMQKIFEGKAPETFRLKPAKAFLEALLAFTPDTYLELLLKHATDLEERYGIGVVAALMQKIYRLKIERADDDETGFKGTIESHAVPGNGQFASRNSREVGMLHIGPPGGAHEILLTFNRQEGDFGEALKHSISILEKQAEQIKIAADTFRENLRQMTSGIDRVTLYPRDIAEELPVQAFDADKDPDGFLKFYMSFYERSVSGKITNEWEIIFEPDIAEPAIRRFAELSVLSCLHSALYVPITFKVKTDTQPTAGGSDTVPDGEKPAGAETPTVEEKTEIERPMTRGFLIDLTARKGAEVVLIKCGDAPEYRVHVVPKWQRVFPPVITLYKDELRAKLIKMLLPHELALLDGMNYMELDHSLQNRGLSKGLEDVVTKEEQEEMTFIDFLLAHRNHDVDEMLDDAVLDQVHALQEHLRARMQALSLKRVRLPNIFTMRERLQHCETHGFGVPYRPSARMTLVTDHDVRRSVHLTAGKTRAVLSGKREIYLGSTANEQLTNMVRQWGGVRWNPRWIAGRPFHP